MPASAVAESPDCSNRATIWLSESSMLHRLPSYFRINPSYEIARPFSPEIMSNRAKFWFVGDSTSCHTCANSSDAAANPKYIAKKNVTIRLFMVEITATAAKIKRNNRYQSDLLVQKMGCTTRARNPRRVIAESIPSGYQHQNCSSSKKNRMLLMPGT